MIIISTIGVVVIVAILAYLLNKSIPPSNCNGDCSQGRNCTCGAKD